MDFSKPQGFLIGIAGLVIIFVGIGIMGGVKRGNLGKAFSQAGVGIVGFVFIAIGLAGVGTAAAIGNGALDISGIAGTSSGDGE